MDSQVILYLANMVAGPILKHFFNGSKNYRPKIPNNAIPYIIGLGSVIAGGTVPGMDVVSGGVAAAAAVGTHQAVKIPVKKMTGVSI
jgi:hypothetical protein